MLFGHTSHVERNYSKKYLIWLQVLYIEMVMSFYVVASEVCFSHSRNQNKRTKQRAEYLQKQDENKAKAYKADPDKKKASVTTATRPRRRLVPVISLHVVDNTCVYYSRPSRTSNQKKRSLSGKRNTPKAGQEQN